MPIITSLATLHTINPDYIFVFNRTWNTDVSTFNLQTALVDAGWDGIKMVRANLVVNSGIVISSNTTAQAAITIPTLPTGSVVNILNNGYIIGMGGRGGGSTISPTGENGGAAMNIAFACFITNNGTIGGGGGGGGSSASVYYYESGGGGGRSGRANSAGGTATGSPGGAGTFAAAGSGGVYSNKTVYTGGNGGNWGAAGGTASGGRTNYTGGAGGAAVIGNSNVTWLTTGTIMGALV